eukprot:3842092-Amphidinium_carterae.1
MRTVRPIRPSPYHLNHTGSEEVVAVSSPVQTPSLERRHRWHHRKPITRDVMEADVRDRLIHQWGDV